MYYKLPSKESRDICKEECVFQIMGNGKDSEYSDGLVAEKPDQEGEDEACRKICLSHFASPYKGKFDDEPDAIKKSSKKDDWVEDIYGENTGKTDFLGWLQMPFYTTQRCNDLYAKECEPKVDEEMGERECNSPDTTPFRLTIFDIFASLPPPFGNSTPLPTPDGMKQPRECWNKNR